MKCKMNIVFIFLLLLLGVVGVTYAYFTETESFENDFVIADFNVVIEENFEQGFDVEWDTIYISKEVFITNKKNTPAIVRVSYNQNVLGEVDIGENVENKYLILDLQNMTFLLFLDLILIHSFLYL